MTFRIALLIVCSLPLNVLGGTAAAQVIDGDMLSPKMVERCGLERAWFTHATATSTRGRIIDMQLYVSSTRSLTVFEVVSPASEKIIVSERDLDAFGDQIGIEGAEKKAQEIVDELKVSGIDAQVARQVIPETTLYVTTDYGVVQAIDAQTGEIRWATPVGTIKYPTLGPAIDETRLAVVNGTRIYLLDSLNGQHIREVRGHGLPMASGAFSDGILFVPLMNGAVEAFDMTEEGKAWPEEYHTRGTVQMAPTVVGRSVAWVSDALDVSVATSGVPGLRFRLDLDSKPAGRIAAKPPRTLFSASRSGSVYCYDLADGKMNWQWTTEHEIVEGPVCVNDSLYVATRRSGLYSLDVASGDRRWHTPNVTRIAAVNEGSVLATTEFQKLVVLDIETGREQAGAYLGQSDKVLCNFLTDWVFVATRRGLVYCLRPRGANWPTLYRTEPEPAEGAADGGQAKPDKTPDADPADPFGGANNALGKEPATKEPKPDAPDDGDPFK